MALTPVPGLTSSTQFSLSHSSWMLPNRAERIDLLKSDIRELRNAWRSEKFADKSSSLLKQINLMKELNNLDRQRQIKVMSKYAKEMRRAFRKEFDRDRHTKQTLEKELRQYRSRYLDRAQEEYEMQRESIRSVEIATKQQLRERIDEAVSARHGLFVSEMDQHHSRIKAGKSRMASLKSRLVSAVERARSREADTLRADHTLESAQRLERQEASSRECLVEEEIHYLHALAWDERRDRQHALQVVARRQQARYASLVSAQRVASEKLEHFFSTEAHYRGLLLKNQLSFFARIVHQFESQYKIYTELSRKYHGELLASKHSAATAEMALRLEERGREASAARTLTYHARKLTNARRLHELSDRALSEREERLRRVREALTERTNSAMKMRSEHLQRLAEERLARWGRPLPSGFELLSTRHSVSPTSTRGVEFLSRSVRNDVLRMIHDL